MRKFCHLFEGKIGCRQSELEVYTAHPRNGVNINDSKLRGGVHDVTMSTTQKVNSPGADAIKIEIMRSDWLKEVT